jgi:hypothetical protein
MPRKQKATLKSVQAAFDAYRDAAVKYIYRLRNPNTESFFSVKGYEKVEGRLKPSVINVPELLAIVGTANRLGKKITITTSGVDDGGQVDVHFVDAPAPLPIEFGGF